MPQRRVKARPTHALGWRSRTTVARRVETCACARPALHLLDNSVDRTHEEGERSDAIQSSLSRRDVRCLPEAHRKQLPPAGVKCSVKKPHGKETPTFGLGREAAIAIIPPFVDSVMVEGGIFFVNRDCPLVRHCVCRTFYKSARTNFCTDNLHSLQLHVGVSFHCIYTSYHMYTSYVLKSVSKFMMNAQLT